MRFQRVVATCLIGVCLFAGVVVSAQDVTPEVTAEAPAEVTAEATAETTSEALTSAPAEVVAPSPTPAGVQYVVRSGDTLFRIAVRFGTTVRALVEANNITNPSLIYAGRTLVIPGVTATPTPTAAPTQAPTSTPVTEPTTTYVVRRGDTLYRIAINNRTTISKLVALNNLRNPNMIYVGQRLLVPVVSGGSAAAPAMTQAPAAAISGQGGAAVGYGFEYGIEAYVFGQDISAITSDVQALGTKWVKVTVNWRDFEPEKGAIEFASLDEVVSSLNGAGLNVLLTITTSPAWARSNVDESGPPDNFSDYATFVGAVAARYTGQVQAYQVWNEPNLRREWNSSVHQISGASYVQLLNAGYSAIKSADANAVVISAGLSPTGFNDAVNAVSDRQFLRDMYASGLANVSDAVGAHPLGWANPPDAQCCAAPVGVETHYQDTSFFFRNTLQDYRQIMSAAGDGSTPIWVTKFGWGTSEDTAAPPESLVYLTYTTLGEQAIYDPRGFELGAEL
ncbi:MAG: LysM peptidoglycan-binding domain-containing protein, partial [Anaerolineae bacterium]|nr:LysM peptidoglycan-binding domain-containing protein [Anaerolineae bacterium]